MELSTTAFNEGNSIKTSDDLEVQTRELENKWVCWAHLPHDINWTIESYIKIVQLNTVEDTLTLNKTIPDKMIKNCMLFLMKKDINPTWEDKRNMNGGCFSFKIANKHVPQVWKDLVCCVAGETISSDKNFLKDVTGITISPKKTFCIVKIWMSSMKYQNPRVIYNIENLTIQGCLFKKHKH
tara:strand:- start:7878 stop:8423 length:546 start_codon:yes stop_codon:yes gene_type:complete